MSRLSSPSRRAARRRAASLAAAVPLVLALALGGVVVLPDRPADADPPPYVLSLGDSLAAGMQPGADGIDRPTSEGYADVLARRLGRHVMPGIKVLKLSCGGETTRTILTRDGCRRELGVGSQVEQAERFLAANPGRVALVTVNVGDNDVERCIHTDDRGVDAACVARGRRNLAQRLPAVAQRLKAAAGQVAVVGIVDYDQYLAEWLEGADGRDAARRSVRVISDLNALMARIYGQAGVLVADAGPRFHTTDLTTPRTLPGVGVVPLAVERICRLTWACSPPPIGHDDHANAMGYRVIAQSVLDALAASVRLSSRPG